MEDIIERFECLAPSGKRYTLDRVQEFTSFRPMNGPERRIPTLQRYDVAGGGHANWIDDDHFEIVATGEIVGRV